MARNPLGQATATVRVVLGDISTSPESPVVEAMTDTDILISWKTPSALNHTPVTCYKVQMGYIGKYVLICYDHPFFYFLCDHKNDNYWSKICYF